MRTSNIGQFISYLNVNGLNFDKVHRHLRSNSVGGVTYLDHQKLAAYLQTEFGVENAPNMSALNIQEIVDVRMHYDMEKILSRRDDEDASLFLQADEEIQQQLLMNPMNF